MSSFEVLRFRSYSFNVSVKGSVLGVASGFGVKGLGFRI